MSRFLALLAAAAGVFCAAEILGGAPEPLLAPFRPRRFSIA